MSQREKEPVIDVVALFLLLGGADLLMKVVL